MNLSFDYLGADAMIDGDSDRLERCIHRLVCAASDLLYSGDIGLKTRVGDDGTVKISIVCHGVSVQPGVTLSVLHRLGIELTAQPQAGDQELYTALTTCPASGATVLVHALPPIWITASLPCQILFMDHDICKAELGSPKVWFTGFAEFTQKGLTKRFDRQGWRATAFDSCESLAHSLSGDDPEPPRTIIVMEGKGMTAQAARRLLPLKSDRSKLVFAISPGSPCLAVPESFGDMELMLAPFSPQDLRSLAMKAPASAHCFTLPETRCAMVVDDTPANLDLARVMLEHLGYAVRTVGTAGYALRDCVLASPTVLLMDIDMPVLDGIETTRQLRQLQRVGAVLPFPIAAFTVSDIPRDDSAWVSARFDAAITKPVTMNELKRTLQRVILLH